MKTTSPFNRRPMPPTSKQEKPGIPLLVRFAQIVGMGIDRLLGSVLTVKVVDTTVPIDTEVLEILVDKVSESQEEIAIVMDRISEALKKIPEKIGVEDFQEKIEAPDLSEMKEAIEEMKKTVAEIPKKFLVEHKVKDEMKSVEKTLKELCKRIENPIITVNVPEPEPVKIEAPQEVVTVSVEVKRRPDGSVREIVEKMSDGTVKCMKVDGDKMTFL